MGVLRLLLALTVVIHHGAPLHGVTLIGGLPAVQTFFMISGFYIFLILREKYVGPGSTRTFYENRALRLYPAYWIILAATLAISAMGWTSEPSYSLLYNWEQWWSMLSWKTVVFGAVANLGLFFQDVMMFLHVDPSGALAWTPHYWSESRPGWWLLLVPQAWSLGVELAFYLIAPFLLRKRIWVIAAVAGCSLALRVAIYRQGLTYDPWLNRFFPTELLFFCVGALACAGWMRWIRGARLDPKIPIRVTIAVIGLTLAFQWIPFFTSWKETPWPYYAIVGLAMPFIFEATRKSKLDRFIGELSYPVYIGHFLILRTVPRTSGDDAWVEQSLLWSLVVALVLVALVKPIERLRERKAQELKGADSPVPSRARTGKPKSRARVPVS